MLVPYIGASIEGITIRDMYDVMFSWSSFDNWSIGLGQQKDGVFFIGFGLFFVAFVPVK